MNKTDYEKLKLNPEKFQLFKARHDRERKKREQKRKNDPIKHAEYLKKCKVNYQKHAEANRKKSNERYHKRGKSKRRIHCFQTLTKTHNRLHNNNLLRPIDLWKIAKKQKCICALTGDKLTKENISLDHIIPRIKGGMNEPKNLRLVIYHANIAKHSLSDVELIELCKKIVNHHA